MRPLKILTWHIHGSYLYYLSKVPHTFYVPVNSERSEGYCGRTPSYQWPRNVVEVRSEDVRQLSLDCVLFQSRRNYELDQFEILSSSQQNLPRVYLEHDPPREHPTDTIHPVDDPNVLLVHVTPFNRLMWNSRRTPSCVVEHGVVVPDSVRYLGEFEKGIAVVNNIAKRGRRLGLDVFLDLRAQVPIDIVGMGYKEVDGLGEIAHSELPHFQSHYRFFFNPIRYTSLGLAVCEAMMIGMPIVGLATTEMVSVVENNVSGFLSTDPIQLIDPMQELIGNLSYARKLSLGARKKALERFHIGRFVDDWSKVFAIVTSRSAHDLASAHSPQNIGVRA